MEGIEDLVDQTESSGMSVMFLGVESHELLWDIEIGVTLWFQIQQIWWLFGQSQT